MKYQGRKELNTYFNPLLIQSMKMSRLKEKYAHPHWIKIQEFVELIQAGDVSLIITSKDLHNCINQILCYRDLCMNDITYHLIVNKHYDFFLNLLEQIQPILQPERNQIIQSVVKGIIKIKKEENFQKIVSFLKKMSKILKQSEEATPQKNEQVAFDIFVDSHFNYQNNLLELKLLQKVYKLLSFNEAQQKFLQYKQKLEFELLIISKQESRRELDNLNLRCQKIFLYKHYSIYRQICDNEKWDKIINISNEFMFGFTQDGLSPYMKMLQKAPFEFLSEYHHKHFYEIQNQINKQQKKHGYNMLHCIAENKNQITLEFIEILKSLGLDNFKNQVYFDQIPLVFYIEKQKNIDNQFMTFLLNQNKSYQDQEGLQIIGQIYAKWVNNNQKIIKPKYKRMYKQVAGGRRNKNKKVKSLYKKYINKEELVDQGIIQQFSELYSQIVQLHKIYFMKKIKQEFEISQYSFSDCHLQYKISNVEQPIIVWNSNVQILKQFIKYIENDFGKNLSQEHIETIQSLLNKLNIQITIQQLILQRKIIILNAVLIKFECLSDIFQVIKDSIFNILSEHNDTLEFPFISYSRYESFQDYLLFNNLISIEQYQYSDPFATLKKLLKLGYNNQENLSKVASKISQSEDQITIQQIYDFEVSTSTINFQVIQKQKNFWQAKPQSDEIFEKIDKATFIQFYLENLNIGALKMISQSQSNPILKEQIEPKVKQLIKLLYDAKLSYSYIVLRYILVYERLDTVKQFFNPKNYSQNQNLLLTLYFLRKKDIRTVEQLLLILSHHEYYVKNPLDGNTISPLSNYQFALCKGWSLGLNFEQFKELIEHNEISEKERYQVLNDLSINGHSDKLKLVLGWIPNIQYLEEQLACPALLNYNDISSYYDLKKAVKQEYAVYKYNFYITFSPLNNETQCNKQILKSRPKIMNNKCLFSSIRFQSDFAGTAKLLNDAYIEKLPENTVFQPGYNSISQILFPNQKYLSPDPDGRLLRKIFDTVLNKQYQQNWDDYLVLIEKNINFYNDSEFRFCDGQKLNLSFIFEKIEISSKRGQFFKKMIDIFIKAQKLENTLKESEIMCLKVYEELNCEKQLPVRFKVYRKRKIIEMPQKKLPFQNYQFRRSQYLFNETRFDKIKKNRFADILKNHFDGISFENINLTQRHKQIFYGLPFENQPYNDQDLFIALMGRRQSSILQILTKNCNLTQILTDLKIIQFLIMHGAEQTVIEILNQVDQVNLEWFYYKGIPLLTYIVFKKWYKLYSNSEQYLFDQWTLKPDILKQVDNQSTIVLTIHQFATLNQFYVQTKIPLEDQFLTRTSQFLIPKLNNLFIREYKQYSQFVILLYCSSWSRFSGRDLERFCLTSQILQDSNESYYQQIYDLFQKKFNRKLNLFSILTMYTSNPDKLASQIKTIISESGKSLETNISKIPLIQVKLLFDEIYKNFSVNHPAIEEIIITFPNEYIEEKILESPKLSLLVALLARFDNLKTFIEKTSTINYKIYNISMHLMKIVMTVKHGQVYNDLFNQSVHLKYYVDAENLIKENQQGNINQQFLNQTIDLLNVNKPQSVDYFYQQVIEENNKLKRAFKLIIKIKEFNYQLEQIEQLAIAKTDYLINKFEFELSDNFSLTKINNQSIILIPLEFTNLQLMEFLNTLPIHYQTNYQKAILKNIAPLQKAKKNEKSLKIIFEESNLSGLYNDTIFLNYELRLKAKQNNIFVYTREVQYSKAWFNQLLRYIPGSSELITKYGGQEIFFNSKTILSQTMIQQEIQESVKQLNKNIRQGIQINTEIEIESFSKIFVRNEELIKAYNDLHKYSQGLVNYPTLISILNHSLRLIEQVIDLFNTKQCLIRFESFEQPGSSPKTCFMDSFFSFGKGYLISDDTKLIYVIQVSCLASQTSNNFYLDSIFNLKTVDSFIQNEFKLTQQIDGLIFRYQFEEILKEKCQIIQEQTNLNIKLQLNTTQIKNIIQGLDYDEQMKFLGDLQVHFTNTIQNDLNYLISGISIEHKQQEQLSQFHQFSKPLKFGYIGKKFEQRLKNHFGILSPNQDLGDLTEKDLLHVCYFENFLTKVKFCKFVRTEDQIFCYQELEVNKKQKKINSRHSRKWKLIPKVRKISLSDIQFLVRYTKDIKDYKGQILTFVDNGGHIYLIAKNDVQNLVKQQQLLTSFAYELVFSKDCIQENQLYLNNFRFKDPQESLSKIEENKIIQSPKQKYLPYHIADAKMQVETGSAACVERFLLNIFAYISGTNEQNKPLIRLPKENHQVDRKEFISYCMQQEAIKYTHSRAGQAREDKIKFYDLANSLITGPINESYYNFHIAHEVYTDLIYIPKVINNNKGEYSLTWQPETKGIYQLFMNGDLTKIKFQVISSTTLSQRYELMNTNQFFYFEEQELKIHLFDEFENFITKVDQVPLELKLISKTSNIIVNSRYEIKNDGFSLYIKPCNYLKTDDITDQCEMEIHIQNCLFIQSFFIKVELPRLTKERLQQFKEQFHYVPHFSKLLFIERKDILQSTVNLENSTDQNLMKFIFLNEDTETNVYEWERPSDDPWRQGPEREYFSQLGIELKSQEKKYFTATHQTQFYFLSKEFNHGNLKQAYTIGFLLAYAIANQLEMGISFAIPFWKVLIGQPIEFTDLQYIIEPQLYSNYLKLKSLDEKQLLQLELTFVNQSNGEKLCQNGSDKKVNQNNLEQYLQLTAQYLICEQHKDIFNLLIKGFRSQYDPQLIKKNFTLNEINKLIDHSDQTIYNQKLLDQVEYVNDRNNDHFVQYVLEADAEKLKLLLKFTTGSIHPQSDRNGNLIKVVMQESERQDILPTANTCQCKIYLPVLQDYQTFKTKLDQAFEWGSNYFGMD